MITRKATPGELEIALQIVKDAGYVAIKAKSYRQAQERQRVAEALRGMAEENRESTFRWALTVCDEERRLRDRLVFVYGVARAHGATVEDLSGDQSEGSAA